MSSIFRHKWIIVPLSILFAVFVIFLFLKKPWHIDESKISSHSNLPEIQIGKSFEVNEQASITDSGLANKTPDEMIREADELVVSTNKKIAKNDLPGVGVTAGQKQGLDKIL